MKSGTVTTITGGALGDEGKGRVVDNLIQTDPNVQAVVRFQGGANAGHTVIIGDKKFALHAIPSGILTATTDQRYMLSVIGRGMVVGPRQLLDEIRDLETRGIRVTPDNLLISGGVHLTLPHHIALEQAREGSSGKRQTTKRAISQTYALGRMYHGIRLGDVRDLTFVREQLTTPLQYVNAILHEVYDVSPITIEEVMAEIEAFAVPLLPFVGDEAVCLNQILDNGGNVIAEGAQAFGLDHDHGVYPYATASNTTPGAIESGCGISPARVNRRFVVVKAYGTRVGGGPFLGEITGDSADWIRNRGHEFGTTTGRPRQVGWFDQVLARTVAMVCRPTHVAVNKVDILSAIDPLHICTKYIEADGTRHKTKPISMVELRQCSAQYTTFPGWPDDITGVTEWDGLPYQAQQYLTEIGSALSAPVTMVGTGPERSQMIIR